MYECVCERVRACVYVRERVCERESERARVERVSYCVCVSDYECVIV